MLLYYLAAYSNHAHNHYDCDLEKVPYFFEEYDLIINKELEHEYVSANIHT